MELPVGLEYLSRELRILMIGAHPDDEDNALLTYFHHVEAAETAYLSLTRGEGGQNYLGPQLGPPLGLLRTGELLAARRYDGAEQRFTTAADFGFSKSAAETLSLWGHDRILEQVVREIRRFRPDLVVSIFGGTPEDGHGQHQAAGVLAREAFAAATDPQRFPQQAAAGFRPWRSARFYVDRFFQDQERRRTWSVDLGSWVEPMGVPVSVLAARGRSRHRSQAMGSREVLGSQVGGLQRIEPALAEGQVETNLTDGLLLELVDLPERFELEPSVALAVALKDFAAAADSAGRDYEPLHPERCAAALATAAGALQRARRELEAETGASAVPAVQELDFRLRGRYQRVLELLEAALGVEPHVLASQPFLVPGDEVTVGRSQPLLRAAVESRTEEKFRFGADLSPSEVQVSAVESGAEGGQPQADYRLRIEPAAVHEMALVASQTLPTEGAALPPPALAETWELSYRGLRWSKQVPLTYRWVDPGIGQRESTVWLAPRASVEPATDKVFLPREATRAELQLRIRNHSSAPLSAQVDWRGTVGSGDSVPTVELAPSQLAVRSFPVEIPLDGPDRLELNPALRIGGETLDRLFQPWQYEHVDLPPWSAPAQIEIARLPVARPNWKIGFVAGTGEQTPAILGQLGATVGELLLQDLEEDLGRWDALIIGIRAYEAQPALARLNPRLFDYVRQGGVLLVEYQTGTFLGGGLALYPLRFERPAARVSEEDAEVRFLLPDDPVLRVPYSLGAEDFAGWVQERGLYFASEWDARYRAPLASHDAGEAPQAGGLLIAELGRGRYIYTGLSFFRQLPAGVPGAFKLFLNLLHPVDVPQTVSYLR